MSIPIIGQSHTMILHQDFVGISLAVRAQQLPGLCSSVGWSAASELQDDRFDSCQGPIQCSCLINAYIISICFILCSYLCTSVYFKTSKKKSPTDLEEIYNEINISNNWPQGHAGFNDYSLF